MWPVLPSGAREDRLGLIRAAAPFLLEAGVLSLVAGGRAGTRR